MNLPTRELLPIRPFISHRDAIAAVTEAGFEVDDYPYIPSSQVQSFSHPATGEVVDVFDNRGAGSVMRRSAWRF